MAVANADQLGQHGFIDVGQLVDVEAAGARLVLSQTLEERSRLRRIRQPVERQAGFAGRKPHRCSAPFAPGGVLIVHPAESDDRRTPHLRFLTRQLRHEAAKAHALLAAHGVVQGREKVVRRNPCHLCLVIRHGRSVLGRPQGSGIKAGPPGLSE
jgi:hypothetical protein